MKSNMLSLALLGGGSVCLVAGFWLLLGLGAALLTAGVLAIAAEFLVK